MEKICSTCALGSRVSFYIRCSIAKKINNTFYPDNHCDYWQAKSQEQLQLEEVIIRDVRDRDARDRQTVWHWLPPKSQEQLQLEELEAVKVRDARERQAAANLKLQEQLRQLEEVKIREARDGQAAVIMKKICGTCALGSSAYTSLLVHCSIAKKINNTFYPDDHCDYWQCKSQEQLQEVKVREARIRETAVQLKLYEEKINKSNRPSLTSKQIISKVNSSGNYSDKGYVYILVNRSIPEFIKIGKTTKIPEVRASELSTSTGVPVPYQVYYAVLVNDCSKMEKDCHDKLHHCREHLGREFFRLLPEEAKAVLEELSIKYKL